MKVWELASVLIAGCNAERAKGKNKHYPKTKETSGNNDFFLFVLTNHFARI